jgi:hypothetical protein
MRDTQVEQIRAFPNRAWQSGQQISMQPADVKVNELANLWKNPTDLVFVQSKVRNVREPVHVNWHSSQLLTVYEQCCNVEHSVLPALKPKRPSSDNHTLRPLVHIRKIERCLLRLYFANGQTRTKHKNLEKTHAGGAWCIV